jgi:hypothetical protein
MRERVNAYTRNLVYPYTKFAGYRRSLSEEGFSFAEMFDAFSH